MRIPFREILKLVFVLATATLAITPLKGSATEAGGKIEQRATAFVEAFNSADPDVLKEFVAHNWFFSEKGGNKETERTVNDLIFFHNDAGDLLNPQFRVDKKSSALFIYGQREKTGTWEKFQFRLHGPENKLTLSFIGFSAPPATPPKADIESREALDWISHRIQEVNNTQPFFGAILIAKRNQVLFHEAYGMASTELAKENSLQTRFNMASGSKMFTAIAIAMLVEDGKIDLKTPIGTYVPGLDETDFGTHTTVEQLLDHTGGAGNYWDEEYEKVWDTITSHHQMLPYIEKNLEPETRGTFEYSNSGYALLALAVENITGRSFYDFVREKIFVPSNMNSTGYPILGQQVHQDLARPYKPQFTDGGIMSGVYNGVVEGARGSGAGGAYTTLPDMFRFAQALMSGKLIGPEMRDYLFESVSKFGRTPGRFYGRGFVVNDKDGVISVGHGGGAPGVNFEFDIYPDRDLVFIMASNFDTIAPREIKTSINELIGSSSE